MSDSIPIELIEQIRQGDAGSLGKFLELRKPRLLGFLRHISGDHLLKVIELDDLFQEICKSAIEALPKIPRADLDFDRWLEQLARRRVVDAHRNHFSAAKRSNARNMVFSQMPVSDDSASPGIEQWLIASITSPSMAVSRNWRLARMQDAISQLEKEHQLILQLRYGQGLSTKEIAEKIGNTDGAVRVALSRILGRLQESLADKS